MKPASFPVGARGLSLLVPGSPHVTMNFFMQAHKFAIVVQLLLGEIPDRATFREPFLRKTLVPYFQLTQGEYALSR